MKQAMRRNPRYPAVWSHSLGVAYNNAERYEEAITAEKRTLRLNPDFWYSHVTLVSSYMEVGREAEARAEAAELLRKNPQFSAEVFRQTVPFEDPAVVERWAAALRKVGLE